MHARQLAPLATTILALASFGCGNDDSGGGGAAGGAAGMTTGGGGVPGAAGMNNAAGMSAAGTTGAAGMGAAGMGTAGMNGAAGMGTAGMGTGGMMGAAGMGSGGMAGMGTGGMMATGNTIDDGTSMTFFATSTAVGDGGNLGGLAGADAFCTQLAVAADPTLAARTWRAYLSTADEDAIDRIGAGPWRNASGVIVANTLAQLHDQNGGVAGGMVDQTWPLNDPSIALDETGAQVPVAGPNVHDILTGTLEDGTAAPDTCNDWTSNAADGSFLAQVGHTNRQGGGSTNWNSVHTVGCSQAGAQNVTQGGGRGSLYCFAVITGM